MTLHGWGLNIDTPETSLFTSQWATPSEIRKPAEHMNFID